MIEKDGKPAFYVLPASLWAMVREAVEDAEDAMAYGRAIAQDDGFTYPTAAAHAELGSAHSVRASREHRGLTLQAPADAAGWSKPDVSQIEATKRTGSGITAEKKGRPKAAFHI